MYQDALLSTDGTYQDGQPVRGFCASAPQLQDAVVQFPPFVLRARCAASHSRERGVISYALLRYLIRGTGCLIRSTEQVRVRGTRYLNGCAYFHAVADAIDEARY